MSRILNDRPFNGNIKSFHYARDKTFQINRNSIQAEPNVNKAVTVQQHVFFFSILLFSMEVLKAVIIYTVYLFIYLSIRLVDKNHIQHNPSPAFCSLWLLALVSSGYPETPSWLQMVLCARSTVAISACKCPRQWHDCWSPLPMAWLLDCVRAVKLS